MKNASFFVLALFFVTSCGVYRVPMVVDGQEYKTKTFVFECGEMTIDSYALRSDYQFDLRIKPDPEVFIYRDSLSVTFRNEKLEYGLTGDEQKINSETDLTLFIFLSTPFLLPTDDNYVRIMSDGVFYCGKQKVPIDEILVDRIKQAV